MYALPDDFDAALFVGLELVRVCFPPYGYELVFEKAVLIRAWGPVSLGGESLRAEDSSPATLDRLTRLPGHRVVDADTEGRGTLVLTFDDDQVLRVVEDGDAYECYELRIGEQQIIV